MKGRYADAMEKSRRAEEIFAQQHNFPGELRARYEMVYAQRRHLQGDGCVAQARTLQAQLLGTRYSWLQSQVGMEMAVCLNYVEKIAESEAALLQSFHIAEKSCFPILLLRNVGFAQGLHNQQHKFDLAWQEGVQGLARYWDGPLQLSGFTSSMPDFRAARRPWDSGLHRKRSCATPSKSCRRKTMTSREEPP